ncbi:MAG: hypothetical protein K0U39_04345 [Alphaproteobacteria bacterium]|nr:hypothetical protein [Alphaproteobacteria bacterium]
MDKFLKGEKLNLFTHLTISAMDRLFLPELLPNTNKIIYLDIDTIVQGDVAELYQTELSDAPLAAREGISPFWNIQKDGLKYLPTNKLLNMQKAASVSVNLLNHHFNSGVLVASLEKIRQDNFVEQAVDFAIHYQLNDEYVLNCYTMDNYVKLSPVWNGVATSDKLLINEQKNFSLDWSLKTVTYTSTYTL